MTWWQYFVIYYLGYQLISFCKFMYTFNGRQRTQPSCEGRVDHEEAEGEDPVKSLFDVVSENEQGKES